MAIRLCAFADEASNMIDGQIAAMKRNGIELLEIRGVDGENIKDITRDKAKEVRKKLDDAGLSVWSMGSPIGKIKTDDDRSILNNINADLVSRAAIVYNNSRYFVGASIVSHTYTYHRSALSIVNGFGIVNVYTGVNLFRK